ncbi:MAG: carboxypeptidase regulatory-like domain-containing protein [Planctomycetes bacterium]|nr:carboxypeptidase regulatory-like domain-containing protein [Planctomycetota bacterium]
MVHPDYCPIAMQVDIAGKDRDAGKLSLQRGGIIQGILLGADGEGLSGLEVSVSFAGRQVRTTRSELAGRFRFEQRLPPGAYRIQARDPRAPLADQITQLKNSGRAVQLEADKQVDIELRPAK